MTSPNVSPEMTSKRKAPADPKSTTPNNITHFTSRNPPWTYLKLQLTHQPNTPTSTHLQPLDPLTARTHLTSALSQFLGQAGTAIPLDILKVTPETTQQSPADKIAWVRVPRQDAPAVVSAVSSWIGGNGNGGAGGGVAWRVCAKGNYLGAVVGGDGGGLFVP